MKINEIGDRQSTEVSTTAISKTSIQFMVGSFLVSVQVGSMSQNIASACRM